MAWRICRLLLLAAFGLCTARSQPLIFYRGILNAASFAPQGLPNGAIARGSIFSIFGRDLALDASSALAFPLSTSLGGVEVEVCRGGACLAAIPLFVSPGQINAIMPSNAPLGAVSLRVRLNGENGNFAPVTVTDASVGIFAANSGGFGPGILQNFVAPGATPLNSHGTAAQPGQVAILWATGLGAGPEPDNLPPRGGTLPTQVEVWVGNEPVTGILYTGRAPGIAGLDQINFVVPTNAPHGCFVPVHVRTNGRTVSNGVTMAIGSEPACRDVHNPLQQALTTGGRVGRLFAQKVRIDADVDPLPAAASLSDWVDLAMREEGGGPHAFDALAAWPPVGACATYELRFDLFRSGQSPPASVARTLDGGASLLLTAGGQSTPIAAGVSGQLGGLLVGAFDKARSAFDEAPTFGIATPGGADVGPIDAQLAPGPASVWTNRETVTAIVPGNPLDLRWSPPGSPALAIVAGAAVDVTANVTAAFACVADGAAGSFTVPGWASAKLPPTRGRLWFADAYLAVGLTPRESQRLSAAGLASLVSIFSSWDGKTLEVRR